MAKGKACLQTTMELKAFIQTKLDNLVIIEKSKRYPSLKVEMPPKNNLSNNEDLEPKIYMV